MNTGYQALIIIWFLILFSWIGFFDRFFQLHPMNKRWVIRFLLLFLFGAGYQIPLPDHGQLSIISFLLPFVISVWVWIRLGDTNRLHVLTASFLVGTSIFLLRLLLQLDPVLMVMNEKYMQVGLMLFLVNVATHAPIQQFVLLGFGLTFSEIGFQYYQWEKTGHYELGSFAYCDLWWLTFISLITFQLVLGRVKWALFWRKNRAEI
ncbi:MAG TPA: hypothetical protein VJ824_12555 [Bacillota bacterium]|nr:hypothetical protein [Bacillota bacterium]